MKGKKLFLGVQAVLCALAAGLLAAAAVRLYAEGSAAQARDGLFSYIFTREKAGAELARLLPVLAAALAVTVAGLILGIRDENADRPAALPRGAGDLRKSAVPQEADRRTKILRTVVLVIAAAMIIAGILNGGLGDVLAKGATVCSECIGLG